MFAHLGRDSDVVFHWGVRSKVTLTDPIYVWFYHEIIYNKKNCHLFSSLCKPDIHDMYIDILSPSVLGRHILGMLPLWIKYIYYIGLMIKVHHYFNSVLWLQCQFQHRDSLKIFRGSFKKFLKADYCIILYIIHYYDLIINLKVRYLGNLLCIL